MIRRLAVMAFLTLLLIGLLTFLVPGPPPFAVQSAARAQEPLVVPYPLPPLPRDPATVSSELLPDPSEQVAVPPQRPVARWASLGYLNDVGSAASGLRRQVVQLKHDVTTDLRGQRRQELSRAADNVLDALDALEDRLVVGRSRAAVSEDYVAVADRVHALLRDARSAAPVRPAARDPAGWVALADERLGEAVSEGGGGAAWEPALVAREADNLVFLARDLERQGEYALSAGPGRRSVQANLHALTDAAEFFRADVATTSPRARLVRDFGSVEEVWGRVAPALAELTRAERLPLDPRARRVEDEVVKLHRLLGLPGAPVHLAAVAEPARPTAVSGLALPASAPR